MIISYNFLNLFVGHFSCKPIIASIVLPYSLYKEKWDRDRRSVCLSFFFVPLITFKQFIAVLWNTLGKLCHCRLPPRHTFSSHNFNYSKMAGVRTSEVDANVASIDVGSWSFHSDRSSNGWTVFNRTSLWKSTNTNPESRWKLKSVFCFIKTTHQPSHSGK